MDTSTEQIETKTYRWRKYNGEWAVVGEGYVDPGTEVTVIAKGGRRSTVVIDEVVDDLFENGYEELIFSIKAKAKAEKPAAAKLPDVPAGYYAIDDFTGRQDTFFVRVDRPTEGKWAGYTFIKQVIGGHSDAPIRDKAKVRTILTTIEADGPTEAGFRYGREIGKCCACNHHLTDKTSREIGMGPDCRAQRGL